MDKLIFNTSMPRSGSELLQVILHQNPRIYGSATSPLLEYQFGARSNLTLPEVRSQNPQLMQDAFLTTCKAMAGSYYSAITERPVVIDKSRGWSHYYEWVSQWNPNPKMICMVRDLRSVLASFERVYRKNRHSPECVDNPAKLENMTVAERANYWVNTAPVGLALKRTLDCFQRGVAEKMHFVRYEDLLTEPSETIAKIYGYIEEKSFEHDFGNIVKEVEEDCSHYGVFGNHQVAPKLKPYKLNDWSDVFSKEIADAIVKGTPWYFQTFDY